jgi:hypothetical protein
LSDHATYICHHGGTDAFTVIDIKAIIAVMLMVLDYQVMANKEIIIPENIFFLVEAPFIRLTALCGIVEDDIDAINNGNDFVK